MTQVTVWLAQIQFYTSLGFLLVFLAFEFGLAWALCYFRFRALAGRDAAGWLAAYRYWARVFALVAVPSLMAWLPVLVQSGALWPGMPARTAEVLSPLTAVALLSLFIFKSCFQGAMLFGQRRLSETAHALVVFMVAAGVTVWAFWLLVIFSWAQAPTGAQLMEGAYLVYDWRRVVLNPALPGNAALFASASVLASAFLIMGLTAAQTLRRPAEEGGRLACRSAVWAALISACLLVASADLAGRATAQLQPAKAAAAAGYRVSDTPGDLVLLARHPGQADTARIGVLPKGAERWLGRDADGLRGLDEFSSMEPPVAVVFWAFRLAALLGLLLLLASVLLLWRLWRAGYDPGRLSRPGRWGLSLLTFSGWPLLLAGLAYHYFGNHPYAVQGSVTLSEVVGEAASAGLHWLYAGQLLLFALLLAGLAQLLRHGARHGVVPVARHRGRA